MKIPLKYLRPLLFTFLIISCDSTAKKSHPETQTSASLIKDTHPKTPFKKWQAGYLDIHHINTGRGDTSIIVMPDGTTMLFDAGLIEQEKWEAKQSIKPLKVSPPKPSGAISVAQWVARYAKQIMPKTLSKSIDYALISHFHKDHYGSFIALNKVLPFQKIIDRNYPTYTYPLDLRTQTKDLILMQYLKFVKASKTPVEALKVGSDSQIKLIHNPERYSHFKIQNVKSNGTIWTGTGTETFEYFKPKEMTDYYKGKYNENPLSLALKISYGKFDYFTGGDNTGLSGFGLPKWFDVETPMAKAVGKVEVTTLNHHGNRDATNEFFVKTLDPQVVVQQSWCSDHPGQEVFHRLIYKDKDAEKRAVFATYIHDETKITYGPWFVNNYKSMSGHIVVRVYPQGDQYEVIILDDSTTTLSVKNTFGPYKSE